VPELAQVTRGVIDRGFAEERTSWPERGIDSRKFAKLCGLHTGAITGIVDWLQRGRYVNRKAHRDGDEV
jgi:hypothetical protein